MAEIKISQLTAAASANGTMEFETNDSGTSKKVTGDQLKTYATSSLGTISTQNANSVAITGGSITGITDLAVADGGTGASTLTGYVKGSGTAALTASSTIPNTDITGLGTMSTQAASSVAITGGSINGTTVGATTASTGAFTTLSASSTVSGTGFSTYLASPPAIGGTAAAAGSFTTLSASGNVTLSGGTANGVLYLNGSKVATSGSALVFDGTNFSTTGTATATKLIPTGNVTAGNGMYLPTTNELAWSTNGSEGMRLDSSGNLGIGTSSPSYRLHLSGSGQVVCYLNSTNASGGLYAIAKSGTAVGYVGSGAASVASSSGLDMSISSAGAYPLLFGTNNTERMRIDSSGNLGLGVTPSAWRSNEKAFQIGTVGSLSQISSAVKLNTNAYWNSSNQAIYLTTNYASLYLQNSGQHEWYTAPSGTAGDTITFTQAMTLDASGNLLVGTTTADSDNIVKITSTSKAGIRFSGTNSVANNGTISVAVGNGSFLMVSENGTGDGAVFFLGYKSATVVLVADPNGRYATSVTAGKISVTKSANSTTATITNSVGSTVNITYAKITCSD